MNYHIGIDAGGSKTEFILCINATSIINSIRGEGFNLTTDGVKKASTIINEYIPGLIKNFASVNDVKTISIGAAGAGRKELRDELESELHSSLFDFINTEIKIYSDAEAAYAASFPDGKGFILIAGTGSIIFGIDEKGKYFRAGGYGKIIDRGSGYSLGRRAFAHSASVLDKLIEPDLLSSEIFSVHKIRTTDELIMLINNPEFNLADAAPLVLKAAEKNIASAVNIIEEEADELVKLISSLINQVKQSSIKLALNGSLIANKNIYSDILRRKISSLYKEINITNPVHPPAMGSILLSLTKA